jgi:hypothetical protein
MRSSVAPHLLAVTSSLRAMRVMCAALALAPVACSSSDGAEESGATTASTSDALTAVAQSAAAKSKSFGVEFADCVEFAGLTTVPSANVAGRVPEPFVVAIADGNATVVVRTARCETVRLDRGDCGPGTVAQIGITLSSPSTPTPPGEGGAISNYTLYYATDRVDLFSRLVAAGVPAQHVRGLSFRNASDAMTVVAPRPSSPPFRLEGPVGPELFSLPFVANWWSAPNGRGAVRAVQMETRIASITFDLAPLTLTVDPRSDVGRVFGRGEVTFDQLTVRGRFPSATMTVTTSP